MLLAGIDLGTLTCRLLVASVSPGGCLQELYADRRILRLGEGVDRCRRLDPSAMARVLNTLKAWRQIIERYRVDRTIAVATSAVRDAANRADFIEQITRECGFEVEVISGEEEARRTMLGIRSGLPAGTANILALDIGGGSTELIVDHEGRPPLVRSFDIGVVRLTERLFKHDPPTADELSRARALVRAMVEAVRPMIGVRGDTTCVGTAGTITSLAAMAQRLEVYQPARIQNYKLTLDVIGDLERDLVGRTIAERRGLPGVEPGREEVIVAGVVILRTVMEAFGVTTCFVSNLGLREGVLLDLAARSA